MDARFLCTGRRIHLSARLRLLSVVAAGSYRLQVLVVGASAACGGMSQFPSSLKNNHYLLTTTTTTTHSRSRANTHTHYPIVQYNCIICTIVNVVLFLLFLINIALVVTVIKRTENYRILIIVAKLLL